MREIILASTSPRRRELLNKFISFQVIPSTVEENHKNYKNAVQLAMALSFEKGYSVAKKYPQAIVLAADTVVTVENEIMGKPKDAQEAYQMIEKLSGKEHSVVTGYSIFCLEQDIKYVDYENTKVTFKNLSANKIQDYIATRDYETKAGAYGIQDLGAILIAKIEGDYDNVVGLPISKIADHLEAFFHINFLKR